MLNWVLGRKSKRRKGRKRKLGKKPAYEKAKQIAANGSAAKRRELAQHDDLEPEILYYFASDKSKDVRREVAENPGTPLQADLVLAKDEDEEVRCELAEKIGRLVPQLDEEENERLTSMTLEVLGVLVNDTLPRVREVVAHELKHADNVPKQIIRTLAGDLDEIVSVPVLQYSPLLNNDDLIEIIARGAKTRALIAVAKRKELGEKVVDAVVETKDAEAIHGVLENQTAAISEEAFERIASEAEANPKWHNAMVYRDNVPGPTVLSIAKFISAGLMEKLIEKHADHAPIVKSLRKTLDERVEQGDLVLEETALLSSSERVMQAHEAGHLDEKRLAEALVQKDQTFVRMGLGLMADLPIETVNQMLNSGSAKAVVAVAWKAGLSMAMAVNLQIEVGRIPAEKIVEAEPGGAYPLSKKDIQWYSDYFFE